MAIKEKACLTCKTIHSVDKCPTCGSNQSNDPFKGRIYMFNNQDSELSYRMDIKSNGEFAIKIK